MGYSLDSLSALRRDFWLATNTSATDDALTEQDGEPYEKTHRLLQHGLWEAQAWVIENVDPWRWTKTSDTLAFSGADSTDGGKHADLPSDFLRLAGDDIDSALRSPDGTRWGKLIPQFKRHFSGDYYYLRDEQLWLARSANPPADLVMDYHYRHALLTTDAGETENTLDFPELDRPLIVAYAAWLATRESWFPGDAELVAKIEATLEFWQERVAGRARRTHETRRMDPGAKRASRMQADIDRESRR